MDKLLRGERNNINRLSPSEIRVLWYMCRTDLSGLDMADKLCVEEKTVKFHITNIFRKLDLQHRYSAMHLYHIRKLPEYLYRFLDRELEDFDHFLKEETYKLRHAGIAGRKRWIG